MQAGKPPPPPLLIDCANGVGAVMAEKFKACLGDTFTINLANGAIHTPGALNNACGADFVKVNQKLPPSITLQPGQRACSVDGDADRLIYYYADERGQFHMLDGDKITALVASFIVELVKAAALDEHIKVGVIQTAYANGSSTKYLSAVSGTNDSIGGRPHSVSQRLPVRCVPTGVKHLHHAAEQYDVGVYFEANGHGTVLFSPAAQELVSGHNPSTPTQATALTNLKNVIDVINQTVGDALSDAFLVEVVLAHKSYSGVEWDSLYSDLPNRLVKVVVGDRNAFETEDAERRLVNPPGLQAKINELVGKYEGGRSFVRPSGTEDVVRVYAEAASRPQADGEIPSFCRLSVHSRFLSRLDLAFRVAGLVYDEAGGDPLQRPREFL
jgi:phosphoacetylglucosamine mutase